MIFSDVQKGDKVISNAFGNGIVYGLYPPGSNTHHEKFGVIFNSNDKTRWIEVLYNFKGFLFNYTGYRDLWYDNNGERSDFKEYQWKESDVGYEALVSNSTDSAWITGWYYQGIFNGVHWFSGHPSESKVMHAFKYSKKA